ncbi:MAG: hypothetical protein ACXVXC_14125 [Nocardioidaceae bacterium]
MNGILYTQMIDIARQRMEEDAARARRSEVARQSRRAPRGPRPRRWHPHWHLPTRAGIAAR